MNTRVVVEYGDNGEVSNLCRTVVLATAMRTLPVPSNGTCSRYPPYLLRRQWSSSGQCTWPKFVPARHAARRCMKPNELKAVAKACKGGDGDNASTA